MELEPKTYPVKGDILILNLDNYDKLYKVLNINGTQAEVLAMFEAYTDAAFNLNRKTVVCNDLEVQQYANSDLDTLLNDVWYNQLTEDAKAAIVPKELQQDIWYWGVPDDPRYVDRYSVDETILYNYALAKYPFSINIGERNIYVLSIQEVLDYINVHPGKDNDILSTKIQDMYLSLSKRPTTQFITGKRHHWLRDGSAMGPDETWRIGGTNSWIGYSCSYEIPRAVRPAFIIDLSKIDFKIN